ncbi:MAG: hypothetical protein A3F35_00725 [Candidatus Woykebacteria bacterium RIFCSPHIGHO2_12_FULL_45_10]|uniref:Uncharacterized protein n=1 Tax=Candidatus Woykebacteria bacterium RIFCSPHIGHO2_12_FULL_45_10 TaxID=1802603 RepID=A0A1G1WNJ9_9BACT|nr:MAG: hypothetical protein A3F35_00725 [Candidatus Woykebacteria bacterium RIFCSPHIGHO2_12_FULL_45_10]
MLFGKKFFYKTSIDPVSKKPLFKPDPIKIGLAALVATLALVILLGLVIITARLLQKPTPPTISETDSQTAIKLERERLQQASAAAAAAKQPVAKLTKAYEDIVGSKDFLRDISFKDGVGTIQYIVNSKDYTTILLTGYQNFADFSSSVFTAIAELGKLHVVIYATGFVDTQGQANTPAMTLEISRKKNEQINWQNNKYRYETYQTNLDVNSINPAMKKEYDDLVKKN